MHDKPHKGSWGEAAGKALALQIRDLSEAQHERGRVEATEEIVDWLTSDPPPCLPSSLSLGQVLGLGDTSQAALTYILSDYALTLAHAIKNRTIQ